MQLVWFQNLILAEILRAQGYLASEYHFVHATKNHDSKKAVLYQHEIKIQKAPKTVQTVLRLWQKNSIFSSRQKCEHRIQQNTYKSLSGVVLTWR